MTTRETNRRGGRRGKSGFRKDQVSKFITDAFADTTKIHVRIRTNILNRGGDVELREKTAGVDPGKVKNTGEKPAMWETTRGESQVDNKTTLFSSQCGHRDPFDDI